MYLEYELELAIKNVEYYSKENNKLLVSIWKEEVIRLRELYYK